MDLLPKALQNLIDAFGSIPGVGPRTAERYAMHMLTSSKSSTEKLSLSLSNLHDGIHYCVKTFVLTEPDQPISPLYSDPRRDKTLVAVVEDPLDVIAIEKTNDFKGTYHVLGGSLSPIEGIGPDQLRIKELIKRIEDDFVTEVILATNVDVEGESTALYIQKQLTDLDVRISRLARGLPVGVDLEYADQITISHALEGRTSLE